MQQVDSLHEQIVKEALTNDKGTEYEVKITASELILYHTLLQDYGLALVGEERYIPLMERSKTRIYSIE